MAHGPGRAGRRDRPTADAALSATVAGPPDPLVRTGPLLRATGIGELLDVELDCLLDFTGHRTWLRVPLDKIGTECTGESHQVRHAARTISWQM